MQILVQPTKSWMWLKNLPFLKWNSAQNYVEAWKRGESVGEWIHGYIWLGPRCYSSEAITIFLIGCIVVDLVTKSCLTLLQPLGLQSPGSSVLGIFQVRILEWVAISSSRDLPDPGIKPECPALAGWFFTMEPPERPKGALRSNKPRF